MLADITRACVIFGIARLLSGGLVGNIIFMIELVINMYGRWFRHFWSSGWNKFDFVLVMLQLTDQLGLLARFLPISPNLLRIVRIVPRILKILRLLRFAREDKSSAE